MLSYVSGNCRYRLSRVPIHKPFVSHSRAQPVDVRVAVVDEHFVQFFVFEVAHRCGVEIGFGRRVVLRPCHARPADIEVDHGLRAVQRVPRVWRAQFSGHALFFVCYAGRGVEDDIFFIAAFELFAR